MMKLPKNVELILSILKKSNFEGYVVGGCVRDMILEKEPNDWDITTNATPEEIQKVFKDFKMINNNGLKHGTISIVIDDDIYEITTYRIDGCYSDGRHPDSVSFTKKLELDLSRRDFTINAMAYDGNKIIDIFRGINDLNNHIIKCVGNPDLRFKEDSLRILRALRFASRLNFEIEDETKKSIFKNITLLNNVSKERIQKELNGILLGNNSGRILREYNKVISFIIPDLEKCIGFDQHNKYHYEDVYNHSISVLEKVPNDLELKLAALLHDVGKPSVYSSEIINDVEVGHFYKHANIGEDISKNILENLKYSKKVIANVCWLVSHHDMEILETRKFVKRRLSDSPSEEIFIKLLDLCLADRMSHINLDRSFNKENIINIIEELKTKDSCFKLKDLAINGTDLIKLGFSGKEIGILLNEILDKVINEQLPNDKIELIKYIKKNRN